jgi:uncharacterized delta-60 repeat protein
MNLSRLSIIALGFVFSLSAQAQFAITSTTRFDGKGDFSDRYNSIVTDANGNVFLGGSTLNEDKNRDYLIEKRNASGDVLWRKIFGASGAGPDEVKQVVLDAQGNVYVTGYANNFGAGNDFWTMKFNPAGDTLWTRSYNDSNFNQYDQANSLAIDANGNVVVAGESDSDVSSITNDDFLVVKYDANGNLLWNRRFNDAGNTTDRAEKVVIDASNNIYVAGRSNNGTDDDYCLIKYNGAGTQQWIQFVDFGGTDRATDMDLDASGNVYVTGRRSNGNDDDYCTVKYNAQGTLQLTAVFDFVEDDRAEAIDVASDGSFVVTGRSDSNPTAVLNYDIYTVKYNAQGTQVWAKSFAGSGGGDDWGVDVQLSASGKVLVAGFADADASANVSTDFIALAYDAAGTSLYSFNPGGAGDDDARSAAFGPNDEMWVCGQTAQGSGNTANRNAALYKLADNGSATPFVFNGQGDKSDNVKDWYIDSQQNVYMAGYSVNRDRDRDFSLVKFGTSGDTLWSRHLSGSLYGSDEESNAIDVDATGNIIIGGYLKNSGTSSDIFLAKYSPQGALLDSVRWDNTMHESDRSYDVDVDATNNVFVAARTDIDPSYTSNDEFMVMKFNSALTLAWRYIYTGVGAGSDRAKFVLANADGTCFAAGRVINAAGNEDVVLVKLSSTGTLLWQQVFDANGGNDDVYEMIFDASGNVVLAISASSDASSLVHDAVIRVYNTSGNLVWSDTYNGANNQDDLAVDVYGHTDGTVVLAGSTNAGNATVTNYDVFARKYNASGQVLWTNLFASETPKDDLADVVTSDEQGNVFVGAHVNNGTSTAINYDAVVYSVLDNGNLGHSLLYAASDSAQVFNFLRVSNGNVWAAGSTWEGDAQRDMILLKASVSVGVEDMEAQALRAYPNPCNSSFNLGVDSEWIGAQYTIYDATGRMVQSGKLTSNNTSINVENLSDGMFSCVLTRDSHAGSMKKSAITFVKSSQD